jgi:UDP-glucuronate 4-epimerase
VFDPILKRLVPVLIDTFIKIDIRDNIKLEKIFKKEKFDFVFNLASQAGVRYSIDHPREYIENNILGFYNIIENVKKYNIKRLFYASSSSVYGENTNFPLKEKQKISAREAK